jgi:hypothetical protein
MINKAGVYVAEENEDYVTIIIRGFAVVLIKTDEGLGLVVDIYGAKDMAENQYPSLITSTYAYDNELLEDENEL